MYPNQGDKMNEQVLTKLVIQSSDKDGWLDRQKFAELIVKECAEICDQQGRVGWNDDRKAQARLDRDLIKQHFGVE
jgi:hypothetical protein